MHILHKLKKILLLSIITLLFAYFYTSTAYGSPDGMKAQVDALSNVVSVYVDHFFESDKNDMNITDLGDKVQAEAFSLGLDLVFKCENHGDKKYVLSGCNRLTNGQICEIIIDNVCVSAKKKSCSISCNLNPNTDGCLKNAQDGNLFINNQLEAVFCKHNDYVDIVGASNFFIQDKNIYKVIQYPSLVQECSGPCGYYAINNILLAYNGITSIDSLLNRSKFEPFYHKLISYNCGNICVANSDIIKIIKNNLKELYKSNFTVSLESVNNLNCFSNKKVSACGFGQLTKEKIRDFRVNGTPQYLIIGTEKEMCNQLITINGMTLNWDNSCDRLYCVEEHWIALKIEWQDENRPGDCPVILSVFDSSGTKDNRFAALIHWYYYIFTHTII